MWRPTLAGRLTVSKFRVETSEEYIVGMLIPLLGFPDAYELVYTVFLMDDGNMEC